MSDADYARYLDDGPHATKAQVRDALKAQHREADQQRKAERRAAWRQRHPHATCSDFVADMLVDLEAMCRVAHLTAKAP